MAARLPHYGFTRNNRRLNLPDALQSGGVLWVWRATTLATGPDCNAPIRAAFIPPLIFVGYL